MIVDDESHETPHSLCYDRDGGAPYLGDCCHVTVYPPLDRTAMQRYQKAFRGDF